MRAAISGCKRLGNSKAGAECIAHKACKNSLIVVAVNTALEPEGEDAERIVESIITVWEQTEILSTEHLAECLNEGMRISGKISVTMMILSGESLGIVNRGNNRLYHISEGRITEETKNLEEQQENLILCRRNESKQGDAWLLATEGFWELVRELEVLMDHTKSDTPQDWISYLMTRTGLRMKDFQEHYSVLAMMMR